MRLNEMNGLGAFNGSIFASLCETGKFFRATCFPLEFVGSFEEMPIFFKFAGFSIEDGVGTKEGVEFGVIGAVYFLLN